MQEKLISELSLGLFVVLSPAAESGDEGIRTPDPKLAKLVLSQLSYTPGTTTASMGGSEWA